MGKEKRFEVNSKKSELVLSQENTKKVQFLTLSKETKYYAGFKIMQACWKIIGRIIKWVYTAKIRPISTYVCE